MWKEEYIWNELTYIIIKKLNGNDKYIITSILARDYLYCIYLLNNSFLIEKEKPFFEKYMNDPRLKTLLKNLKKEKELEIFVNQKILDFSNKEMINKLMKYYTIIKNLSNVIVYG